MCHVSARKRSHSEAQCLIYCTRVQVGGIHKSELLTVFLGCRCWASNIPRLFVTATVMHHGSVVRWNVSALLVLAVARVGRLIRRGNTRHRNLVEWIIRMRRAFPAVNLANHLDRHNSVGNVIVDRAGCVNA